MSRIIFLCGLALGIAAAPSYAGDCANAMTQSEMNRCEHDVYLNADDRLNQVYRALLDMLDDRGRQRLIEAERAWINYRDAHCRSETMQSEGGTMHALLYDSCLTDVTNARTEQLRASLDCERHRGKCDD